MNTLEKNKLIAEFMGVVVSDRDNYTSELHTNVDADLKYHTSWKWLMPVVEELLTYGCEVVVSSNGVTTIYAPSGEVLAEESSEEDDHMHDATYKAIVKVLKENLHKPC